MKLPKIPKFIKQILRLGAGASMVAATVLSALS